MRTMHAAVPAATGLAVLAVAGAASASGPQPLHGSPLGKTGLRLVVAAKPPIVVDVDNGHVTRLRGASAPGRWPLTVTPVGGRAAVVFSYEGSQRARLWIVRARPVPLGRGNDVVAAPDGRSVWVVAGARGSCSLRHLGLDGRRLAPDRAISCRTTLTAAGTAGLVVNRVRLIDPSTGRTLLRTRRGAIAAAGTKLVLAGPGGAFTLTTSRPAPSGASAARRASAPSRPSRSTPAAAT